MVSTYSSAATSLPLRNVARLDDLVAAQVADRRLSMLMFGLFGLLGLVIAAVGVYGIIAGLVSQQTKETGIPMALGATRARVVTDVFGAVAPTAAPAPSERRCDGTLLP